jgi:hypothetical protein
LEGKTIERKEYWKDGILESRKEGILEGRNISRKEYWKEAMLEGVLEGRNI